jgi:hypothetical protein
MPNESADRPNLFDRLAAVPVVGRGALAAEMGPIDDADLRPGSGRWRRRPGRAGRSKRPGELPIGVHCSSRTHPARAPMGASVKDGARRRLWCGVPRRRWRMSATGLRPDRDHSAFRARWKPSKPPASSTTRPPSTGSRNRRATCCVGSALVDAPWRRLPCPCLDAPQFRAPMSSEAKAASSRRSRCAPP